MYLKQIANGDLVEILELQGLFDPFQSVVQGRVHAGEELQEPAQFPKAELVFPSGEHLPQCWINPDYRAQRRSA